ncbi:MAG: SDR family NAD(P)-dependent oxidoreductase [Acidimicrobiia bacterium]
MTNAAETLVFITGATQGIGAALARKVPWPDARVVNISRRQHPELESVIADITQPEAWDVVAALFERELSSFDGERAIFVHNAIYPAAPGFAGEGDPAEVRKEVLGNVAAPLVLGDAFIRACRPGYESGLVMVSSAAAKFAMEGRAVYGGAKSAMEQWVRGVRAERRTRGTGPWVVAVRPGFVVTERMLEAHQKGGESQRDFPGAAAVAEAIDNGDYLTPDQSAEQIWAAMPPAADGRTVLFFGKFLEGTSTTATAKP